MSAVGSIPSSAATRERRTVCSLRRRVALRRFAFVSSFATALALLLVGPVAAQTVDDSLWVTDGTVYAVARDGDTIYIGGQFEHVGPAAGNAVALDAASALPLGLPDLAGQVFAVASDGAGGWYLGGDFTRVGGVPRSGIAHVGADFRVTSWNPDAGPNSIVYALALDGSTLYVGGGFASMGGQTRAGLAALNVSTGLATAWNPNPAGEVRAIAASGGIVYVGGDFHWIGGEPREYIAALDAATGLATEWDPQADWTVTVLQVSGSTVYAGGSFGMIGWEMRPGLAALDAATGFATAWDPQAGGEVYAMALDGGTLYVGGGFTSMGGQPRNWIAALDIVTGLATSWDPDASGAVYSLALSGGTVYAGGEFISIGGSPRNCIAALDIVTGLATSWDPDLGMGFSPGALVRNAVYALGAAGSAVLAGGRIPSIGGVVRRGIAAIDATTGLPTDWNPDANGIVRALAVRGGTLYAGGDFTVIGGQPRLRIAALDAATGLATAWNADADESVYALELSGGSLFAGGRFITMGGETRYGIAKLDTTTGTPAAWDPSAGRPSHGTVYTLAVGGNTVYVGGDFDAIGGQFRSGAAAIDAVTGVLSAWDPGPSNTVYALVVSGNTVYAGGLFNQIGGQPRYRLAALDAVTGSALAWNPDPGDDIRALATSGGTVYVGGFFGTIGGAPRWCLAAVDSITGLATPWNPGAGPYVYALEVAGRIVYAGGDFITVGGHGRASLTGIAEAPVVFHIEPDRGGNDGLVSAEISGIAIEPGATAVLSRAGEPDISGTQVAVAPDGRSLTVTFDIRGAGQGAWDVTVTNPDLASAFLPGGFTVESGAPYEVRMNLLGAAMMRPDRRRSFDVVLENQGNSDVTDVVLWISGIPTAAAVEPGFALSFPPQEGGEPDWSAVPLTFPSPSGQYLAMVIPRLPPGATVRRFYLTVPNTVTDFVLNAAVAPPWAGGDVFRACLGGGPITAPGCMASRLEAVHAYLAGTPGIEAVSGIGVWAKIAWQCEGAPSLGSALVIAHEALDFMRQAVDGSAPGGCGVALVPYWKESLPVTIVTSVDPNDKLGAGGVGTDRNIGGDQLLPYTIRFENLETATAPAQEVVVVDMLDLATLDPATVSLGPVTFAGRTIHPPPGFANYSTDVDLRPQRDLIVRVGARLDAATGMLSWSFRSIDPATGMLPDDPLAGFLPPNANPPEGEGSVLFTVMPKPGLAGGVEIRNQATIDFDGSALATAPWANLLDTSPPASHVLPLPAAQDSLSFTVRWEAEGATPDLHDYSVYVAEDGAAYRPWRVHVAVTADTIVAPGGHTYAFYSLARDSSGNLEPAPPVPDAETATVLLDVGDGGRWHLALHGAIPNPAVGAAQVWFTLPDRQRTVLEVMDVAGRRLLRRDVGALGPGRHVVDVSAAAGRPGLYFLRLSRGGETLRARIVVLR